MGSDQIIVNADGQRGARSRPPRLLAVAVIAVCVLLAALLILVWPAASAIIAVLARNAVRVVIVGGALLLLLILALYRIGLARGRKAEAQAAKELFLLMPNGQPIHVADARQLGAVALALQPYWNVRQVEAQSQSTENVHTWHQEIHHAPAALAAPAAPLLLAAPSGPAPLPVESWLERINDEPDVCPHVAATGPTGSGKTTLVLAALGRRPGRFVICTPKAKRTDPWNDFPAVRLQKSDGSYAAIAGAVALVYQEMLDRNAQDADVTDDWLTLVIDDYSTVTAEQPAVRSLVLRMLTLGRSCRVRLVLLDTETNVKAWGLEGRGEARSNLLYVECEERTHAAIMYRWNKQPDALDTTSVPALARAAQLADRAWRFTPRAASTLPQAATVAAPAAEPTVPERIATWLAANPWQTSTTIAAALQIDIGVVRTELTGMKRRGEVEAREATRKGADKYEYASRSASQGASQSTRRVLSA